MTDPEELTKYEVTTDKTMTILPATHEEMARVRAASLWDCDPEDVEVCKYD